MDKCTHQMEPPLKAQLRTHVIKSQAHVLVELMGSGHQQNQTVKKLVRFSKKKNYKSCFMSLNCLSTEFCANNLTSNAIIGMLAVTVILLVVIIALLSGYVVHIKQ